MICGRLDNRNLSKISPHETLQEGYIFYDPNTTVSAFLFNKSNPEYALQDALTQDDLFSSMNIVEELAEVLYRDLYDRFV